MATEGLRRWLSRPVDPLPLVVFRVAFGLLLAGGALRFLAKGWIHTQYLEPTFHFTWPLFGWVGVPPAPVLYALFWIQAGAGLAIALGGWYRPAVVAFFLTFTWVELLDQTTYLNHYYFLSLVVFLLFFLPLHHHGSLDARGRRGPAPLPGRWVPLVLQLQVAVVYVYAGVAKLEADWLLHAQPLRLWLAARSGVPVLGPLFDQVWVAAATSWGGAAFDLLIPFFLFRRRTRPWAYLVVLGFHGMTALLFPIGVFPWVMMVATLVFFDGTDLRGGWGWMRTVIRSRRKGPPRRVPAGAASTIREAVGARPGKALRADRGGLRADSGLQGPAPLPSAATTLLLGAFFVVQLLVPLRHLAYPGPVLWTEEGYRFSWRVMLAEKTGTAFFHLEDPVTGRRWEVLPGDHLTPMQEKQFAFQPDMILAFAHHLRDLYRTPEGFPRVRAEVHVSLNGRAARLLVDPGVDLARVPRTFRAKEWILPPGSDAAQTRTGDLPRPRGGA